MAAVAGLLLTALTHHRQETPMTEPMTPEERELVERMRDDAIANGDNRGAADLSARLAEDDAR